MVVARAEEDYDHISSECNDMKIGNLVVGSKLDCYYDSHLSNENLIGSGKIENSYRDSIMANFRSVRTSLRNPPRAIIP